MNYNENDDNALYHYTTSCAVVNILKTQCLRLSHLTKANDPKEIEPALRENHKIELNKYRMYCIQFFEYYGNNVKYFSFTKDIQSDNFSDYTEKKFYDYLCNKGFNRPRMWAQYAENHSGACVCFNKENLLDKFKKNKKIIQPFYFDDINYVNYIDYTKTVKTETEFSSEEHIEFIDIITDDDIIDNKLEIERKMRKYYLEYFFTKLSDWSDEKEKRILAFSGKMSEIEVDISRTIKYIVLGYKCEGKCQNQIKYYCDKLGVPVLKIDYLNGNAQYQELK
jgi:hypothetical protein